MSIHIVSKTDYTAARLIPADPAPRTPLPEASSKIRIRSSLLSLTTNNLTYARLGGRGIPGLAWWSAWPLPATAPADVDLSAHCRIAAWGYLEVVESVVPALPVGTQMYGYVPLGNAVEEMHIQPARGVDGAWDEVSERRRGLGGAYNRYTVRAAGREGREWDALMLVLYGAAFKLDRFVFNAGPGAGEGGVVHPLGERGGPWTEEDGDLRGAVVVMLGASGKTALGFADLLRRRGEGRRPAKVVAVGSEWSKGFCERTGLFDAVVEYDDVDGEVLATALGGKRIDKVVLFNFGGRGDAPDQWADALKARSAKFQAVVVGGDPTAVPGRLASQAYQPGSGVAQMNAAGVMETAAARLGEGKVVEEGDAVFDRFKQDGAVKGLKLIKGRGMAEVLKGWEELASGRVSADVGLVYELL